jgi:hypothetical protein
MRDSSGFPFVIALAARPPSRRPRLGLAALIALQSLASPVYVSAAILGPLGGPALARLGTRPDGPRRDGLRLLGAMALAPASCSRRSPAPAYVLVFAVCQPGIIDGAIVLALVASHPTDLPWGTPSPAARLADRPCRSLQSRSAVAGFVSVGAAVARGGAGTPAAVGAVFGHAPLLVGGRERHGDGTGTRRWYGPPILGFPTRCSRNGSPLYRTLRESFRLGIAGLMGLSLAARLGFALSVARRCPAAGARPRSARHSWLSSSAARCTSEYRAPGDFGREPLPTRISAPPAARRRRSARTGRITAGRPGSRGAGRS